MENYICINGKKAELTEEQMKVLGIELPKKSPFERVAKDKVLYYITNRGIVEYGVEKKDFYCNGLYNAANYCTDKAIMEQRALHETLNRLLWRYAMEHNKGCPVQRFFVNYSKVTKEFGVHSYSGTLVAFSEISFSSREVAENAIEEIIEPFMKAHPDFKF